MKPLNNVCDRKTHPVYFYRQMLEAEDEGRADKPIKVKQGRKTITVQPSNPMYNVIKWYGEYE